jgi:hypothetical protein
MRIVKLVAGDSVVRVPWNKVATISSEIHLVCPARDIGLMKGEDRAKRYIPRKGAM